jgi:putative Mg2+ transporter-C (MgtC) family protein
LVGRVEEITYEANGMISSLFGGGISVRFMARSLFIVKGDGGMGHFMNDMSGFFWQHEVYFRIVVSAVLGFMIGWDRTSKNKPAGLKTYTYVSVACTLITIVSIEGAAMLSQPDSGKVMDPLRLAAQIVSGLGFLGAGVILKDGLRVKGLTSAAMIFYVGGVGIGIGAGFYSIVIFATLVTFIITKIGNFFEEREITSVRLPWFRKKSKTEEVEKKVGT